jgi:hypothetical protein
MHKKRTGLNMWIKGLLGCGCLTALFVFAVSFYLYRLFSSSFTMDPARVTAIGQELSPSLKLPAGFKGAFAMDTSAMRMAMFQDGAKGRTLGLIWVKAPKDGSKMTRQQYVEQLEQSMENREKNKGKKKTLEHSAIEVQMGKVSVPGVKRLVEEENGKQQWEYFIMARDPKNMDYLLAVMGTAPAQDKDQAFVEEFARSVDGAELEVTSGDHPSATPAAIKTP